MDRQIIYPGQIPLETDLLNTNKYAMIAVAKLAAALLGTSTVVNGLACVPTSPASLQVIVNPGEMYSLANVDGTAYSSIPADTTHSILKQGISMDAVTLNCPAPVTAGQSVNYLIQATYQDSDTGLVALPYYNASNPSQAWSGPNNTGTQQATARKGIVTISVKAGVSAPTGTQSTPAPDAGYTGLWVVTVANGQTTITAGNIFQAAGAPILPKDLLHSVQAGSLIVGTDIGSSNACAVSYTPQITALDDGMVLWFKAAAANTGATTLNVNGIGARSVVGANHSALQGGEIVPNGKCQVVWNAALNAFVMVECTGGARQTAPATKSQHAVQFGQLPAVVGSTRRLAANQAAAGANLTITADEIVVESALGGLPYRLSGFSQTFNTTNTGVNGMDTGTVPLNGYVGIYAIYSPATGATATLGINATSVVAPSVYNGANMPAGYAASALISVVPTDGSGNIKPLTQRDRLISIGAATILSTSTGTGPTLTSINASGAIPPSAVWATGAVSVSPTSGQAAGSAQMGVTIYSGLSTSTTGVGASSVGAIVGAGLGGQGTYAVQVTVPQTLYYTNSISSGGGTFAATVTQYSI